MVASVRTICLRCDLILWYWILRSLAGLVGGIEFYVSLAEFVVLDYGMQVPLTST